ncbi:MAG: META domain-containing protein [Victivallales bacterium]|jgi:heat shock protein HslJ|nr:META domain-containing protein [Victivallales bacterium]
MGKFTAFCGAIGIVALIAGCATQLKNTVWIPDLPEGQDSSPAWFEISETNTVHGNSGVNRFTTMAVTDPDKGTLSFLPGASTLMTGPNLDYETQFKAMLQAVRSYSIQQKKLTLYDTDGKTLATFKVGSSEIKTKK